MLTMENENAGRLLDLETRNTHLERMVQELSEGLYAQQRQIERIEAQLRKVTERLKDFNPSQNDLPQNERPPHY